MKSMLLRMLFSNEIMFFRPILKLVESFYVHRAPTRIGIVFKVSTSSLPPCCASPTIPNWYIRLFYFLINAYIMYWLCPKIYRKFVLHLLNPLVFCPLIKKSSGNPYLKILDFSPAQSTFGTPSTTFLDIIKTIFRFFGTPLQPKDEKWKFHIWSVRYQNRVKRVIGFISEWIFRNIFKNEDFGFWNFLKMSNFVWLSQSSKLKAYVHIVFHLPIFHKFFFHLIY